MTVCNRFARVPPSIALSALLFMAPLSAEPTNVRWSALSPSVPALEDPFKAMPAEQLDSLRRILRIETATDTPRPKVLEEAASLRQKLAGEGLDVDELFAKRLEIMKQRQWAAEKVSTDVLNKAIRLSGYVVPLTFNDEKAVEFLLVPTMGACIHTPSPPANQVVHVDYPEGILVKDFRTAVRIEGTLNDAYSVQTVRYFDGQTQVAVSYQMLPDRVAPYQTIESYRSLLERKKPAPKESEARLDE
ncbi:DUF3299 domain-containing protein [Marinobacter sp. F4206]|uniref:DUF3299 domain-containing protein n=1 Tax=Marinobacter sp. F4206 TaxID=2861777 RepID=UPI001C5DEB75|nr:DUF3299 domain-containing protein [Marinobacter sp. F4206]